MHYNILNEAIFVYLVIDTLIVAKSTVKCKPFKINNQI